MSGTFWPELITLHILKSIGSGRRSKRRGRTRERSHRSSVRGGFNATEISEAAPPPQSESAGPKGRPATVDQSRRTGRMRGSSSACFLGAFKTRIHLIRTSIQSLWRQVTPNIALIAYRSSHFSTFFVTRVDWRREKNICLTHVCPPIALLSLAIH